jgi:hypothetical protein
MLKRDETMTYRTGQNILIVGSFLVLLANLFLPPVLEKREEEKLPWLGTPSVSAAAVVNVWTYKKTGFYYCPDSRFYGKLKPGAYMTQEDALERGYRPVAQDPCR